MSELEDMIGKILGDPAEMERISQMALQLMGGADSKPEERSAPGLGLDPGMLAGIGKIMSKAEKADDKTALLSALTPYLAPERRSRFEKAMRISRLARIAGMALEEYGDGHV